jgi:hypothetical protein
MARKTELTREAGTTADEFERQMAVARKVMDDRWIALRALASGDQYPGLDANELLKMAEEERGQ